MVDVCATRQPSSRNRPAQMAPVPVPRRRHTALPPCTLAVRTTEQLLACLAWPKDMLIGRQLALQPPAPLQVRAPIWHRRTAFAEQGVLGHLVAGVALLTGAGAAGAAAAQCAATTKLTALYRGYKTETAAAPGRAPQAYTARASRYVALVWGTLHGLCVGLRVVPNVLGQLCMAAALQADAMVSACRRPTGHVRRIRLREQWQQLPAIPIDAQLWRQSSCVILLVPLTDPDVTMPVAVPKEVLVAGKKEVAYDFFDYAALCKWLQISQRKQLLEPRAWLAQRKPHGKHPLTRQPLDPRHVLRAVRAEHESIASRMQQAART